MPPFLFFFNAPATTHIYTLSLHDALPICTPCGGGCPRRTDGRSNRCARRTRAIRSSIRDRKSTRLNSSHQIISYAVFCLKKKTNNATTLYERHADRLSVASSSLPSNFAIS